ncbi:MAG: hypothetical protein ACI4JM_12640 [Oscillospiraceae bacterium]
MKKELTKLEANCESIRKNIEECGRVYILIAYKIYELYYYETYKEKYKNIVECCETEFGFKKSTTYRLLGIVEKFGEKDVGGMITYNSVTRYNKYSYSQLSEMLSLTPHQREQVTPETTISEIRNIKKNDTFPTSGKDVEKQEDNFIEVLPVQLQIVENNDSVEAVPDVEKVPTSGKIKNDLVKQQLELYNNDVEKTISGLIERVSSMQHSSNHFRKLWELKAKETKEKEETIKAQSQTIAEYIKIDEKNIRKISILETDNRMLKTKVQQLEEELNKLKKD